MKNLLLTPGDIEVFRWLWMLRVMTLGQLRRVRYYQPKTGRLSVLDNVRKRLKRLRDGGYLIGDTYLDSKERIYYLGEQALPALRERYGIDQRRLYHPRFAVDLQIRHPLLVSECAVRVTESIRRSPLTLPDLAPLWVPFIHTHAIGNPAKKRHVERFVSQDDIAVAGRSRPLRIRPDLVFALAQGNVSRLYFLEADRGSESPQEIAEKLLGYAHYQNAFEPSDPEKRRWQRYGAMRDYRVLFVTTDQRRVESLTTYLEQRPGFHLLALTSILAVKEKNMVFDPIWTNKAGPDRPLAKRPEPKRDRRLMASPRQVAS